jgi:hypothetical protein
MTNPKCLIVTRFFVSGAELQIETSDGALHTCREIPRYDLDRLNLYLIQSSGSKRGLIFLLTLTTATNARFHFTWNAASTLSAAPILKVP